MKKNILLIAFSVIGLSACNIAGASSSKIEPSSSVEPSSSTSEPAHPIDLTKLKKNVQGIKNYQADILMSGLTNFDTGSMKSNAGEMKTAVLIDGNAYSVETTTKDTTTFSLTEYASEHGVSVDAVVEMAKMSQGRAIADKEKDTLITIQTDTTEPTLYNFDSEAKQTIKYTSYNDNIVNAYYLARIENHFGDAYKPVMKVAIDKGSKDEDKGTISFTIDDAFRESEEYQYLLEGQCYASAFTLYVENNYPTKIDFTIDLALATRMTGHKIDEMTYSVAFSKINNVHLVLPEGRVACDHHILDQYYDETNHYSYCPACGIFLSSPTEHDFDEAHHICKTCGYVKGLSFKDSQESKEKTTTNKVAEGLYAFSYFESEKEERYDVSCFTMNGEEYYDIVENRGVSYCISAKALITHSEPEESYLADDSCVFLSKIEYKLYTNVEIEEIESEALFNGKTLEEFVASATADTSFFGYNVNISHESEESTETHIDNCHTKTVSHCSRCSQDVLAVITRSHVPTNFKEITFAEFTALFGRNNQRSTLDYQTVNEDFHFFELECSSCHKKIYMVCPNSDGYETDHALTELAYDFYEKEGVRILTYKMDLTLEHIDDGTGHCMFCHEEMA